MHLTLHLTGRCNMRCEYCYAAPHGGVDMSFETARAAVDLGLRDLVEKHPGSSLGVIFFGGEPLLRRALIEDVTRYCKDIAARTGQLFHYKITTNGTLLDESFLTNPDTHDIFVALSHDGARVAHDRHRVDAAGHSTFARLDGVIPMLLRHKPYAPVMAVVTPDTEGHYAESVASLFSRGFRYLIFSLHYAGHWDRAALAELKRQYKQIAEWYYVKTVAEEKFYFSPFEVKIASHVFPGRCHADRCELGQTQISVGPDGTLYPCTQFVGDTSEPGYVIGHVSSGIDETARQRLFERNREEKESCATCAVRERCNHHCGCLNKQATGRIDTIAPSLCAHERTVLPIADRLAERLYKRRSAMFIQKHYNELYPLVSLAEDVSLARAGASDRPRDRQNSVDASNPQF
jgi:uncharacterized protein